MGEALDFEIMELEAAVWGQLPCSQEAHLGLMKETGHFVE